MCLLLSVIIFEAVAFVEIVVVVVVVVVVAAAVVEDVVDEEEEEDELDDDVDAEEGVLTGETLTFGVLAPDPAALLPPAASAPFPPVIFNHVVLYGSGSFNS